MKSLVFSFCIFKAKLTTSRVFQIAVKGGGGTGNFTGGIFLLGEGNLSRKDFGDSNPFQS